MESISYIFQNREQGTSVEEYTSGEVFKVVVGSNNIRIFNIKRSEINSDLKIIIARLFLWVLPFILHFFIFHSRQFLLNERSGNFTALAFMSKMLLPPYSLVDRTVKPKTEHALWGKIASIYGFQYQLFRVLVGFPNNERVVNKTQPKTNIRLQSDHLNWIWCTVSLSKIQ